MEIAEQDLKRKKRRSVMIAWALVAMAVFFFLMTVFRLGGNVLNRSL